MLLNTVAAVYYQCMTYHKTCHITAKPKHRTGYLFGSPQTVGRYTCYHTEHHPKIPEPHLQDEYRGTASQWIQRYTKERIKVLLENKNLTISEIADEMEFSSYSFFTRYVKKLLGVSPKEYRERV